MEEVSKNPLIVLLVVLFAFSSCTKDDESDSEPTVTSDYRDKYLGTYEFVIYKESFLIFDESEYDTSYFIGEVRKQDTSMVRLIIEYGEDTIGVTNSLIVTESPDPIVDSLGQLTQPELPGGSISFFGEFIGTDSLYMRQRFGSLGSGTVREIYGKKL